ncbi:CELLULOSE SYNTHASE INTERACTIVE 3 [Wolffia australiana]
MSNSRILEPLDLSTSPSISRSSSIPSRESHETATMEEDHESTMATVAHFVEQLHGNMSSPNDKELVTTNLLAVIKEKKDARVLIGSHSQAMPLFISVLRTGTTSARVNVAATLSALCREDDLRVKVLLGGCIPPLLSLLKSESLDARKAAAEAIYEVSSGGLSEDHVGMKILLTEGVVPTLWDQLNPRMKQDKVVEGFVTGALRNLCGEKDGYWNATLEAGGVEIITGLLSSGNSFSQSNAASLLARLVLAFDDSVSNVVNAGTVGVLLHLLSRENDVSVRASAADALEALSSKSSTAKKAMVDANGLPALIGAVVAPSKECMQGEACHEMQRHAVRALGNICGGMSSLVSYLGELSCSPHLTASVADIVGALAYSLMVFDEEEQPDVTLVEEILIQLLKPGDSRLVHDRVLEALASLYGNNIFSQRLQHADAKRMLIGLITMASGDVHEHLIQSLTRLCSDNVGIWASIGRREGIQMLISLLGLSGEQLQEYTVALLAILTNQVDECKWAITAAGGIPPLVQLLETGSSRAREDAANVLWNLCCYSDDIRACVESAGAVSALLWLLKSGGQKGQEASSKALKKLIREADSATINQLLALLLGDSPTSKSHIISVLGHVLMMASHADLVQRGSPANRGLKSLVEVVNTSNEETQECVASVLADLFSTRQDICDSLATDEIVHPCMKLLTSKTQVIATQSARALGALSRPTKTKQSLKVSYIAGGDVQPLINLAKTSSIDAAETAVAALANLLSDPQIAREALAEDVVPALTRVLSEGSTEGKMNASRALHHLLNQYPIGDVLVESSRCRFVVLSLVESLASMDLEGAEQSDPLDLLSLLIRTKQNACFAYAPWSAIAEAPASLDPLTQCLAVGLPPVQDKVVEILSRLCLEQPVLLGDLMIGKAGCVSSLAERVMSSASLEVRAGATAILICVAREHRQLMLDALEESGLLSPLVFSLTDMIKQPPSSNILTRTSSGSFMEKSYQDAGEPEASDPAAVLGGTVALWLLCLISSSHERSKHTIVEAGGLDVLCDRLSTLSPDLQGESESGEPWVMAVLLAILFRDTDVGLFPATMRIIPSLSLLLRSEEVLRRYFAAQAMASLVSMGDRGIHLAVANSGAVAALIALVGHMDLDAPNLVALSEELSLLQRPDQVILQRLFQIEDVRTGATARKSIPVLVDLLRPMPERPGAPSVAVQLLTQLSEGGDANKLAMAEAGALEALTKYLSLSPQDSTEAAATDLLRILFTHPDLPRHEAAFSSVNQLVAVLRLGSRNARFSAARALHELFDAEIIRDSEAARQALQPLVDVLNSGTEREQEAALVALIKLTDGNLSRAYMLSDVDGDPLCSLHKILVAAPSPELKKHASDFCYILFGNPSFLAQPMATECVQPLITLMASEETAAVESAAQALERLLGEEHHAEMAASLDVIDLLVGLVSSTNYRLSEACVRSLIKLGKDRPSCKLAMVEGGIIDQALDMLSDAPGSLCSQIVELLLILTNNSSIARSSAAAQMVEPLFLLLHRSDITMLGQQSALQALVNILEKPQSLAVLKLTPSEVIEPLISFLESPSQAIQQLGTELLSHLLAQEHFQQDITTKNAVVPLVQLAGIGILSLQQTAVRALESISVTWPEAVAEAGGLFEISKVIVQSDPLPSHALWESAALVLCNVLRCNPGLHYKVPLAVLVRLLQSTNESTAAVALTALIAQERGDAAAAPLMAQHGAIAALLELLQSHQCEEASATLLEVLLNNVRVREMKAAKHAIAPLAQYLLDPLSRSPPARLLAALALGDLFQNESLARAGDAVSACRALVSLLEDQPTEDMKTVAVCALQNLVVRSRTNRRAVAEAGGILVIQELLLSPNPDVAAQAALLIKFLFSNHTLQEYVSNELIRSLTAALEKELWSTATINEEVLRTIQVIFANFKKLRMSEAATLCIPHLVGALKAGSEAAQESALDTLCLLKDSWSEMNVDIAKAQALVAAEAIPILQLLVKTCPPSFHERADALLHCLPGCLTVTIKRGTNLKQTMGSTNAFCRLTIGNSPPKQTKVVPHSSSPEWKEGFTWAFDVPPKGQKLFILCKSKNTFGKSTLGRVTIQIDKVVSEGVYSGLFSLNHDGNRDGSARTLEIEIVWSNRTSVDGF